MSLQKHEIEFRNIMKEKAEKSTGFKLDFINPENVYYETKGYEIGKKYYIGYWGDIDECIDLKDGMVVVKGEDGRIRSHMTTLDKKMDFVVVE